MTTFLTGSWATLGHGPTASLDLKILAQRARPRVRCECLRCIERAGQRKLREGVPAPRREGLVHARSHGQGRLRHSRRWPDGRAAVRRSWGSRAARTHGLSVPVGAASPLGSENPGLAGTAASPAPAEHPHALQALSQANIVVSDLLTGASTVQKFSDVTPVYPNSSFILTVLRRPGRGEVVPGLRDGRRDTPRGRTRRLQPGRLLSPDRPCPLGIRTEYQC